jgi:hypothetical protein
MGNPEKGFRILSPPQPERIEYAKSLPPNRLEERPREPPGYIWVFLIISAILGLIALFFIVNPEVRQMHKQDKNAANAARRDTNVR